MHTRVMSDMPQPVSLIHICFPLLFFRLYVPISTLLSPHHYYYLAVSSNEHSHSILISLFIFSVSLFMFSFCFSSLV